MRDPNRWQEFPQRMWAPPRLVLNHEGTSEAARCNRRIKQISLREVARRMGISAAYLSDLELGRRKWSDRLCDLFRQAINGE